MTEKATIGWRDLGNPRVLLMLAFGFSAGLPFLLIFGTLSVWLRESGVPVTTIGLFSWLALAYTLKFLWAPVVDAFDVPVLARYVGRRRAWMIVCQAVIAVALVGVGFTGPGASLALTAAFTFLLAFGSAAQDVVVDGWRIDAAPLSQQGLMAAAYQLGYRFGLMSAGAGALYIAEFASWRVAYVSMAALMGIGFVAALLAPIVDRAPSQAAEVRQRFTLDQAFVVPLADLYRREGRLLVPILVLIALYRLPDFVGGVMATPLYVDLGFSKTEIANVSKLYGVWVGIVGAFAGGLLLPKLGLRNTLLIGAVIGAASNLMFTWLAGAGHDLQLLVLAISIDNFSGSFAGTALIAYMSGLTAPGFAATQYALLSSLYALPGKLVGGISGFIVAAYGYATFFALTAAVGIPVVMLALWVTKRDRDDGQPAPTAPPP